MPCHALQVLVLDSFTRDVITPLLRLNDLRKAGVTLYLLIDSERQNVPDVPAIYFTRPASDNVKRAIQAYWCDRARLLALSR